MKLYRDIPSSEGMKNVLKRARHMTEFYWCPCRALPSGYGHWNPDGELCYSYFYLPPYQPQKGLIYSSVRETQKYIGTNVSFETFVSALANPNSVLYTKSLQGRGKGMFSYYGITCSIFVCYCFNIRIQRPCRDWENWENVEHIDISNPDSIRLCDILLDPSAHIALITEINRDSEGHIVDITVSEGTQPKCLVTKFTIEEFYNYWFKNNNYILLRYKLIDEVSYSPIPYVENDGDPELNRPSANTEIIPDYGDKANYYLGETVRFSVFDKKWTEILVCNALGTVATIAITNGQVEYTPDKAGYYEAYAITEVGEKSENTHFCMTSCTAKAEKSIYGSNDSITISYECACHDDEVIGYIVNDDTHYICESKEFEVSRSGTGNIIPGVLKPGKYYVIVLVLNKFGIYKSEAVGFEISG